MYTCGLNIQNIQTWDTTYYDAGSLPGAAITPVTITTVVTAVTAMTLGTHYIAGPNYPNSIWPLMPDVAAASLATISFDTNNVAQNSIGAE